MSGSFQSLFSSGTSSLVEAHSVWCVFVGMFNLLFICSFLQDDEEVPTLHLEGTYYPYHMAEYSDGTLCDLTQVPRRTLVYYICNENGLGEMYQIKEMATCEYSVIVVLADLCNHPRYRYQPLYPSADLSKIVPRFSIADCLPLSVC